jgi:hypothetical protein
LGSAGPWGGVLGHRRGRGLFLRKGQNIDRLIKYKPARETLSVAGYRIDLSTGPLLPPVGKCQHVGMAAVYERRAGGVQRIAHGIDPVPGRTKEEALRKMKAAILHWLDTRESQKKTRPKR